MGLVLALPAMRNCNEGIYNFRPRPLCCAAEEWAVQRSADRLS
jgi:hypothetical protein